MNTKIAFLILAHTDPPHLCRLCHALGPDDDILVHIDRRADFSPFERLSLSPNVKFTRRRVSAFWGDISIVEATLILLAEATQSKVDYLRLVLLSGASYPLRRIHELRKYFCGNPDHLDIAYASALDYPDQLNWKISRYHFRKPWLPLNNKYLETIDKAARKLTCFFLTPFDRSFQDHFPELVPYVGGQFWSITPECAAMILQFVQDHPEFLRYHKHSWAPDEHFFHTIVGNSRLSPNAGGIVPFAYNSNVNNLHTHRYPVLTMEHLAPLLASGKFFARKAATGRSDMLLDYLDQHVLR